VSSLNKLAHVARDSEYMDFDAWVKLPYVSNRLTKIAKAPDPEDAKRLAHYLSLGGLMGAGAGGLYTFLTPPTYGQNNIWRYLRNALIGGGVGAAGGYGLERISRSTDAQKGLITTESGEKKPLSELNGPELIAALDARSKDKGSQRGSLVAPVDYEKRKRGAILFLAGGGRMANLTPETADYMARLVEDYGQPVAEAVRTRDTIPGALFNMAASPVGRRALIRRPEYLMEALRRSFSNKAPDLADEWRFNYTKRYKQQLANALEASMGFGGKENVLDIVNKGIPYGLIGLPAKRVQDQNLQILPSGEFGYPETAIVP